MFILPAILLVAVFLIYPIGFVIYISFFKWAIIGTPKFAGLENYVSIFKDKYFWNAVGNTVYYMVLAVPSQIGLGLLLAFLVNKRGIFGRDIFRTIFFIPMSVSFVAAGIILADPDNDTVTRLPSGASPARRAILSLWQTKSPTCHGDDRVNEHLEIRRILYGHLPGWTAGHQQ
jgi:hypothetical protein